jgi:hypothetical protein
VAVAVAVEAGEGAVGGTARHRVRVLYGLCQSKQDCSILYFIAFLSDSAIASALELNGLTTLLIELMALS